VPALLPGVPAAARAACHISGVEVIAPAAGAAGTGSSRGIVATPRSPSAHSGDEALARTVSGSGS
jgi:hypothetical protein